MKSFVLFGVLFCVKIASGEVSKCYLCNSYSCNDPFDKSTASEQQCNFFSSKFTDSNGEISISSASSGSNVNIEDFSDVSSLQQTIWNQIQKYNKAFKNLEYSCVKSNYYHRHNDRNQTFRGCIPKNLGMTACDVVSSMYGYTKLNNCYSCDTDLCNSGKMTKSSILVFCGLFLLVKILL